MLYGNIIFIKKTGGDGSKFPVTEKDIKIGRSEGCLIRIYNSQVAPQHCQLIIEDNGQATLKNLSKQTILNGKPFDGNVALCHGDVFQLGERLARWEYLPTSKYYSQVLSPTGRLVAVVIPQQRPLGEMATASTSASHSSVFKSTPLGKRHYSERLTSENSSGGNIRKSSGDELLSKVKKDLSTAASGRLSFNLSKMLLQKGKERKSLSGVSSKTPKVKLRVKARKSTLPSWKVNIVSPERKSPRTGSSVTKSTKKSAKSPKSEVKTPLKNIAESKSSQNAPFSVSESRTPQKVADSLDVSMKSASKSVMKTHLKNVVESPKNEISVRTTRSFSKSPSPKKTSPSKVILSTPKHKSPKLKMLVQSERSERKINSHVPKGTKRLSLILKKIDSSPGRGFKTGVSEKEKEKASEIIVLEDVLHTSVKEKKNRNSLKNTPKKLEKTPRKSLLKSVKSVTEMRTPRKSVVIKTPGSLKQNSKTPRKKVDPVDVGTPLLIDLDFEPTPKKMKYTPRESSKGAPESKTPGKKAASVRKSPVSTNREISIHQSETTSPVSSPDISKINSIITLRKSIREKTSASPSKTSAPSPRGVRRKLSPSSCAERAAKMLKTSSPKKPDKNKKAALLVLGKANRKQLLAQNVKVLLKQKIVKKAIKQSTVAVSQKVKKKKTAKLKKGVKKPVKQKNLSKSKKSEKRSLAKVSGATVKSPMNVKSLEGTPKGKAHETSQSCPSKVLPSPRLSLKNKPTENSSLKQNSESSRLSSANDSNSTSSFEQVAENYIFNSNRRSKRLSSKNDTGRPDFIELSPTALGLMPKHINVFKTPNKSKRRSSSLVTPKNLRTTGIIKSASTSKLGNRKSVRFSSKDIYNSDIYTAGTEENTDFDFSSIQTPDVTVDLFISPLTEKKELNESKTKQVKLVLERISKTSLTKSEGNSTESKTCVRKLLQSPQIKKVSPTKKSPDKTSEEKSPKNSFDDLKGVRQFATPKTMKSPKNSLSDVEGVPRLLGTRKFIKSPKNDLSDVKGVKNLLKTPKPIKSPKNDLSDVRGVKKLLRTPKMPKSPKNDLTDVQGVKKLLRTPKEQRSPKNDLTDVQGVKKLLQTPRIQKSPRNDLSDVRGVKKLLQTPKDQKNPKNDLTDVHGVKKLLQTPRIQKSPRNDLTDVRGVKKLLQTPKEQKSPKNDLTDVQGVKKLLKTPRIQKSPRNDLTDVRGVKKLLRTPKEQKSSKNDLTDVRGVKKLLATPKIQKSPKNDLTNVDGVKQLLGSPRIQKSPKNDLSDLRGVKKLLGSPKSQKSPKNDLNDLRGVRKLLSSPRVQKSPKNDLLEVSGVGNLFESQVTHLEGSLTSVKQLLVSKSPKSVLSISKKVSRKPSVNDFRAIRGRRTIYSTPKVPKNDLSDVTGVRELFSRHKPISDYNISLTGVAELFDLPEVTTKEKPAKKSEIQKTLSKSTSESEGNKTETRRCRPRKAKTKEEPVRSSLVLLETELRAAKRKATVKGSASKKPAVAVKTKKETKEKSNEKGKTAAAADVEVVKTSLKRKAASEDVGEAPTKTRRKLPAADKSASAGTSRRIATRSKKETSLEEVTEKSGKNSSAKAKEKKTEAKVQSKSGTKTGSKRIQKVQSRSQSNSKTVSDSETKSLRKTRSGKDEEKKENAQKKVSKTRSGVGKKTAKSTAKKSKSSPVVKRSTRRK